MTAGCHLRVNPYSDGRAALDPHFGRECRPARQLFRAEFMVAGGRFGSEEDVSLRSADVRYSPESGHRSRRYSFVAISGGCRQRAAGSRLPRAISAIRNDASKIKTFAKTRAEELGMIVAELGMWTSSYPVA
jgi:hypothetical protein